MIKYKSVSLFIKNVPDAASERLFFVDYTCGLDHFQAGDNK
jgi:hypothetical protein